LAYSHFYFSHKAQTRSQERLRVELWEHFKMVDSKAVKPLGELRQLMAILKLSTGQEGRPRDRAQLLTLVGLEIHILTKEQRSLNCKLILEVAQTKGFTKTLIQLPDAVFLFPFGIIFLSNS
jgi:hypothetical protein